MSSPGTVTVRKNELKPWRQTQWVIPPDASAEFVCQMEDVLNVYHRPPDPLRPLVCFDEASKQLVDHVQSPIDPKPGRPQIIDYEYQRNGTGNIFMMYAQPGVVCPECFRR
jgi:hypothetical protein